MSANNRIALSTIGAVRCSVYVLSVAASFPQRPSENPIGNPPLAADLDRIRRLYSLLPSLFLLDGFVYCAKCLSKLPLYDLDELLIKRTIKAIS